MNYSFDNELGFSKLSVSLEFVKEKGVVNAFISLEIVLALKRSRGGRGQNDPQWFSLNISATNEALSTKVWLILDLG